MIYIKYTQLNSKSNEEQKQEFERLVLLNGADLDIHQNRNTPEEILSKWGSHGDGSIVSLLLTLYDWCVMAN